MAQRSGSKPLLPSDTPPTARVHLWQIQAIRDLLWVGSLLALLWLGYAMRAVTVPLLIALLLAYLFEPLVSKLSGHPKVSRPVVVGGLLFTVGVVVLAALALVIPVVVRQTGALVADYRDGRVYETARGVRDLVPEAGREGFDGLLELLPKPPGAAPAPPGEATGLEPDAAPGPAGATGADVSAREERIRAIVREEIDRALGETGAAGSGGERPATWLDIARGSARAVSVALGGIIRLGFLAFLIPFYFFFFSVWYPAVARFARSLVPESNRARAFDLLRKMDRVIAGFVRGRIVISLIMGVALAIGWRFCQVPYSITLGLFVGVFCAVPYLGVVGVPLAVGLLFFGQLGLPVDERTIWLGWWGVLLWPTAVFAAVQILEGYVLTPLIAGKATGLDPVTILVAVLAGGSIMGVYGMLLAIPAAACLKIV
ncbi:MAG: AI-2E family transporter, partial [Myxococcota bacterium]